MNLFEIEKEYLAKKLDGMSLSEIRENLEKKGLSEEQVSVVIRSIDNKILRGVNNKAGNSFANEFIYIGLALILIGLFITIATYTGFISLGNRTVLMFGPILGGIGIMAMGFSKKK